MQRKTRVRRKIGRILSGGTVSIRNLVLATTATTLASAALSTMSNGPGERSTPARAEYYRPDGVRITHNPYSPEMAAKYGRPGATDNEGFDPYGDTVGAGIYSGIVQRNADGSVVIGRQYQNHNTAPGPVYAGGGYSPVSAAIASFRKQTAGRPEGGKKSALEALLDDYPDLANDVSTGGALPLHTCGMSRENQYATQFLLSRGADMHARDTYGYTALHRMASNNLPVGAKALLMAGANPEAGKDTVGTPMDVALSSRANLVVDVLNDYQRTRPPNNPQVTAVTVQSAGCQPIVGLYLPRSGAKEVPTGFSRVCHQNAWDAAKTWNTLNGDATWFAHQTNDSYIYYNKMDSHWWIDGPDGLGVWIAHSLLSGTENTNPPASEIQWKPVDKDNNLIAAPPKLLIYRGPVTGKSD